MLDYTDKYLRMGEDLANGIVPLGYTIKGYVRYVAQFSKFFGRSPDQLTCEHARQYQLEACTCTGVVTFVPEYPRGLCHHPSLRLAIGHGLAGADGRSV